MVRLKVGSKYIPMENKKTTELLDLIWEISKDGDWTDEATEILDELRKREPFITFASDENLIPLPEALEEIRSDIKLLKRHKHEDRTGDVMIRI